jgi:hypothetical protein
MSSEHSINSQSIETPNDLDLNINNAQEKKPNRVNINSLLSRVREKEKKEKKENIVIAGLVGTVIVVTGIIASL